MQGFNPETIRQVGILEHLLVKTNGPVLVPQHLFTPGGFFQGRLVGQRGFSPERKPKPKPSEEHPTHGHHTG